MTTKKEATRLRLLEAGKRMAMEKGALPHIDVRLTEVLAEVGLTTGAAYNIWGSQDEFRVDLAVEVAQTFSERKLGAEGDELRPDGNTTLADYLQNLAATLLSSATEDMSFLLPLRFWGVRSLPESIETSITDGFQHRDVAFAAVITNLCEYYGLAVHEDRSVEELAGMALACVDGAVLRNRVASDAAMTAKNSERLGEMLGAIVQNALVPAENPKASGAWNVKERRPETALAS